MSFKICNLMCVLITGMNLSRLDQRRATNRWDDPAAEVYAGLFVRGVDISGYFVVTEDD